MNKIDYQMLKSMRRINFIHEISKYCKDKKISDALGELWYFLYTVKKLCWYNNNTLTTIHDGSIDGIKDLLKQVGGDLKSKNPSNGMTLLEYATISGDMELVDILCNEYNVDINTTNDEKEEKESALNYAAKYGRKKIAKFLCYHELPDTFKSLKDIDIQINCKNRIANQIYNNQHLQRNIINSAIDSLHNKMEFCSDLLYYAWYFENKMHMKKQPFKSELFPEMLKTCKEILLKKDVDFRQWKWLQQNIIESLIWFVPHPIQLHQLFSQLHGNIRIPQHIEKAIVKQSNLVEKYYEINGELSMIKDNDSIHDVLLDLIQKNDDKYFKKLWVLIVMKLNKKKNCNALDNIAFDIMYNKEGEIHEYLQMEFKNIYCGSLLKSITQLLETKSYVDFFDDMNSNSNDIIYETITKVFALFDNFSFLNLKDNKNCSFFEMVCKTQHASIKSLNWILDYLDTVDKHDRNCLFKNSNAFLYASNQTSMTNVLEILKHFQDEAKMFSKLLRSNDNLNHTAFMNICKNNQSNDILKLIFKKSTQNNEQKLQLFHDKDLLDLTAFDYAFEAEGNIEIILNNMNFEENSSSTVLSWFSLDSLFNETSNKPVTDLFTFFMKYKDKKSITSLLMENNGKFLDNICKENNTQLLEFILSTITNSEIFDALDSKVLSATALFSIFENENENTQNEKNEQLKMLLNSIKSKKDLINILLQEPNKDDTRKPCLLYCKTENSMKLIFQTIDDEKLIHEMKDKLKKITT
eukprot:468040_1